MRQFPPFPELVAFEAVARHRSVTLAARELCVTQSAVSHRIRRLEQYFGITLVRRTNTGLMLTDAGLALLPDIVTALDHVSSLARREERLLRVAAGSALCTWWLASRLPNFLQRCSGVSVELVPIDSATSPLPEVDVRILWIAAETEPTRPRQASLFVESVFPVCSPDLLPDGRPLRDARLLNGLPLLHKASNSSGEWSWALWFKHLGVQPATPRGGELSFRDMGLVMSAAVDGAGVALTRSLIAHDSLASGRLVPAVADFDSMASSKHHVARWPNARDGDAVVTDFVEWLVEEARTSLNATAGLMQTHL